MHAAAPLVVRGLSRRYGQLVALAGLDLSVGSGECVALIGHNGSGKTTAVRLIAGLLDPTAGEVVVAGSAMDDASAAIDARAALAVVPDSPVLYDDLTVAEHLELVALAHGVADAELARRIDELLARLGLAAKRDARPRELSRGMRQKLALCCALVHPYRLLVLDEPVVGLDPASQRTLREIVAEAKRADAGVLLTTHQLEFARGLADRAVVLADGEVVADGPYDDVVDGPVVRERGL